MTANFCLMQEEPITIFTIRWSSSSHSANYSLIDASDMNFHVRHLGLLYGKFQVDKGKLYEISLFTTPFEF